MPIPLVPLAVGNFAAWLLVKSRKGTSAPAQPQTILRSPDIDPKGRETAVIAPTLGGAASAPPIIPNISAGSGTALEAAIQAAMTPQQSAPVPLPPAPTPPPPKPTLPPEPAVRGSTLTSGAPTSAVSAQTAVASSLSTAGSDPMYGSFGTLSNVTVKR